MLLSHGRHIFPQKGPKAAIATWNRRRLGQGNWGESSWLKLRMLTKIARAAGFLSAECTKILETTAPLSARCTKILENTAF